MPARRDATRGPAALVFLSIALAFLLMGCELTVEDPQTTRGDAQRGAMSTNVAQLPDYGASVSAIDFDPPLTRETLQSSVKSVKLLAAVENKGTMPLSGLVVDARITSQKGEFTASERTHIDLLAPGETKLAEFTGVAPESTLPRSPSYSIRVSVTGRQADSNHVNNTREVIVRVAD